MIPAFLGYLADSPCASWSVYSIPRAMLHGIAAMKFFIIHDNYGCPYARWRAADQAAWSIHVGNEAARIGTCPAHEGVE